MNWSISSSQMFKQCPRKWFYHQIVSQNPKDELQKETKILKKLQSIYAWRGKIVDDIISFYVIPKLNNKEIIYEQNLIEYSSNFAHKSFYDIINNETEQKEQFFELEYFGHIDEKLLHNMFSEIELSLRNFVKSQFLKDFYENGVTIFPQRNLHFNNNLVHVRCKLDAICVYNNKPPIIVDWKVNTNSHHDHKSQLALYAYVLSKSTPHKGLENVWTQFQTPTKIELLEFQLLHGRERYYSFTNDDFIEVEDFIFESAEKMTRLLNDKKYPSITPSEIPTTLNPYTCERCQFKKICWREL